MNKALKSKSIYARLLHRKLRGFDQAFKVTRNAGFGQNEIRLKKVESWRTNLYNSDPDNKVKRIPLWQISHKALYTASRLNEVDPIIPTSFLFCNNMKKTREHVFTHCAVVQTFW